jgi:filamentous hemagglutinin family protein
MRGSEASPAHTARRLGPLLASGVVVMLLAPAPTHSQVTLDGSLGPRGALAGPHYLVGAELGQLRGRNLFHSFGEFSLRPTESATFSGPPSVANILGRVTGGAPSSIDGLLRSTIPGANLFLLNPRGVVFGPNAALDVGGSFHVGTADIVRLADGGTFATSLAHPTVLTVAEPVAFGFLSPPPAPVSFQNSRLQVPQGRSLSVVAGAVRIVGGRLEAPAGRVAIASLGAAGDVGFDHATQTPGLVVDGAGRLGQIEVAGPARIDASGAAGGAVVIRGGRLVVRDGAVIRAGTHGAANGLNPGVDVHIAETATVEDGAVIASSQGAGHAGDVRIRAGTVRVSSDALVGSRAFASGDGGTVAITANRLEVTDATINTGTDGTGRSGDIVLSVGSLAVTSGALIDAGTSGSGRAGNVVVTARDFVTVAGRNAGGFPSQLKSNASAGEGAGGRIVVTAPVLTLDDGRILAESFTAAPAGAIELRAGRLAMSGGAVVDTSSFATGPAGTVTITASEAISIVGAGASGLPTRVLGAAFGEGAAGRVSISAPRLSVDGGLIGTPPPVDPGAAAAATAGEVVIDAGTLTLTGGGAIDSSSFGTGRGGDISVNAMSAVTVSGRDRDGLPSRISTFAGGVGAAGQVAVATPVLTIDGGSIATFTAGPGDAGAIGLVVDRLSLIGGGSIDSSTAGAGRGGRVTIDARDSVTISGRLGGLISGIRTTADAGGDAGSVRISAPSVNLDGGIVNASSFGAGRGGDVTATAGRLTLTDGAVVASGSFGPGPGGSIDLRATDVRLEGRSAVATVSVRTGNAGNLAIAAARMLRSERSSLTTEAVRADGGDISLTVGSLLHLVDSQIVTAVGSGEGRGGNITIDPRFVVLDHSQIRADAFGGPGGNVRIVADGFLTASSVVSASSALGVPGVIDVQAPIIDISGNLATLPQAPLQGVALLRESCAVRRAAGAASSLLVRGRGGLPPDPGAPLPSPADAEGHATLTVAWPPTVPLVGFAGRCSPDRLRD